MYIYYIYSTFLTMSKKNFISIYFIYIEVLLAALVCLCLLACIQNYVSEYSYTFNYVYKF